MLLRLLTVFLVLTSLAQADEFLDRLDLYYPRYDYNGAINEVLGDPARAERAIPELEALAERSDPDRARVLQFYVDFIRRVLHVHAGGPDPGQPEDAWDDTPIKLAPAEIDVAAEEQRAREFWRRAAVALDVEAYPIAERWLREAIKASHRIAWARHPVPEDLADLQKRYRLYLMGLTRTGYIYPQSADTVVVQDLARGRLEDAQLGLMAFVQAGRMDFDPKTIDSYLPRLVERAGDELRFSALSFQAERQMQQRDLGWDEFRRRHDEVWAHFQERPEPTRDPLLKPLRRRWTAEAAEFWLRELEHRARVDGEARARDLLAADFRRLAAAGLQILEVQHLLDRVEAARGEGKLDEARELAGQAERALAGADQTRENEFWVYARQEQYVPAPSYTRLKFLQARLYHEKFRNLIHGRDRLTKEELAEAAALLRPMMELTDPEQPDLPRVPDLARYALLAEGHEGAEELEAPLTTLLYSELLTYLTDDPVLLAEILLTRSWLLVKKGREQQAREALEEAVKNVEEYLTRSQASQRNALRVRQQAREAYEALAERLLREGKNEEAFELLARLAQVETRPVMQEAFSRGAGAQLADTLREAGQLELATRRLEDQERRTVHSTAVTKAQDVKAVGRLLADTRARYYQTIKELQEQEPDFTRLAVRPLNFARLQKSIPPDTTVVQYFPSAEQLYIFVADSQQLKVRTVAIGREALDEKAITALRNLSSAARQMLGWSHPQSGELKASLTELNDVLIEPVREDLGSRPVLAVIPTGVLSYLPFPALVTGENGPRPRFLVEDRQVVTLLKAVDLDSLVSPPPPREGSLVGLGNPDGTLAAAEQEVLEIGRLFEEHQVVTTGEATADRLRQLCAGRPAFLHLATHGHVDPREPLESYLLMADGPLTLADITALELGEPSLVTLSACRTGLGEQQINPGQDLTTLAEAFWFAGGRSLVASMWSVSDRSTAELMVRFYQGLLGDLSKARALQQAQLALLQSPETSAPYYWAPFVLIGDWR